jgi:hypothetical protein
MTGLTIKLGFEFPTSSAPRPTFAVILEEACEAMFYGFT